MSRRFIADKCLVFDMLRFQHPLERVAEEVRLLTIVKTEAHFVKVGLQMLCANPMPRSDNSPLQERECRFHRVRIDVCFNPDVLANGRNPPLNSAMRPAIGLRSGRGRLAVAVRQPRNELIPIWEGWLLS
jgi:hypothetical protein